MMLSVAYCSASRLLHRTFFATFREQTTTIFRAISAASGAEQQQGPQPSYCQRLRHRSLLRAHGTDVFGFLQGLVTNDVGLLQNTSNLSCSALYTMLLNVQGRVLFDLILYRVHSSDKPTVLIECNANVASDVLKTLSKYRLRKKVDLTDVSDEIHLWAMFSPDDDVTLRPWLQPSISLPNRQQRDNDVVLCTIDPRLPSLGHRIILPSHVDAAALIPGAQTCPSDDGYNTKRCSVGVGEGTVDFPPGQCFPLECNLAFLNGVSFSKGCYVGQELTARTNYTGVIRKRIVPLVLPDSTSHGVKSDCVIVNSSGKECGKVRTVSGSRALSLLRISELTATAADSSNKGASLRVRLTESEASEFVEITAVLPSWWPTASDPVLQQTLAKDNNATSNV